MDVATGLALLQLVWKGLRSGHARRIRAMVRGRWPLSATIRSSDVYSGYGLVTAVPDESLPREVTLEAVHSARKSEVAATPVVHVLAFRNETGADLRVEEIFLIPRGHAAVPELTAWAALNYNLPGAGGRGEEAEFRVWFRRGLTVPIPLLARAYADGAEVSQPRLRPSATYGVMLSLYPDQPGHYSFDVVIRCSVDQDVLRQLVGRITLLDLEPEDYGRFSRVIRLLTDLQIDSVAQTLREFDLRERVRFRDRERVELSSDRAFAVRGRALPGPL